MPPRRCRSIPDRSLPGTSPNLPAGCRVAEYRGYPVGCRADRAVEFEVCRQRLVVDICSQERERQAGEGQVCRDVAVAVFLIGCWAGEHGGAPGYTAYRGVDTASPRRADGRLSGAARATFRCAAHGLRAGRRRLPDALPTGFGPPVRRASLSHSGWRGRPRLQRYCRIS